MAIMKLILLEEDTDYNDMLAVFLRTTEYGELFSLQSFTSQEACLQYLASENAQVILMVNESFLPLPDSIFHLGAGCMLIMSETNTNAGILEYPSLCKYQPLDQLLSTVKGHFNEYSKAGPLIGNKDGQVIGLYSAVDGSGKTVTAVHLARQLVQRGERVLCLTLEHEPSRAWYPPASTGEDTFSELLYYVKSQPQHASSKFEQLKLKHPWGRFDYVAPSLSWKELAELSGEDVEKLLQVIQGLRSYDRILLDLDSQLHASTYAGIRECHQLIWLLLDEQVHLQKAKTRLQRLDKEETKQWLDKATFVRNKSIGGQANDFGKLGFPIAAELPYVPEWKSYAHVQELTSAAFVQPLLKLLPERREAGGRAHVEC